MSWEEEFNQAMAAFGGAIVPDPIEYRIHYNGLGEITMCSMQNHPDNQQYLVVDKSVYEHYYQYRVNVQRKTIEKIAFNLGISVKLKKSDHGYAVIKNHAGLLLENDEDFGNIEYYDTID